MFFNYCAFINSLMKVNDDDHIDRMGALMEHFSLQQTKLGSQMNRANLQREINDKRLLLMN